MERWKSKGRRNVEESVNILKKKSECKKNYRKIGNKKEIYIDVKINKDEYVKSIIYSSYIYIYIVKKKRNK